MVWFRAADSYAASAICTAARPSSPVTDGWTVFANAVQELVTLCRVRLQAHRVEHAFAFEIDGRLLGNDGPFPFTPKAQSAVSVQFQNSFFANNPCRKRTVWEVRAGNGPANPNGRHSSFR